MLRDKYCGNESKNRLMRKKSSFCVNFFTSFIFEPKTPEFSGGFGHPLRVFLHKKFPQLMIEKKRYSTTNSVQYIGLHKAQSALEKRKTPCTLQWKVHPGQFQPYVQKGDVLPFVLHIGMGLSDKRFLRYRQNGFEN